MADKKLKENEIEIGGKLYPLFMVKIKFMKNNFYGNYIALKEMNLIKLLKFSDGQQIFEDFLEAVLEDLSLVLEIQDSLDNKSMKQLLKKVKEMNEIDDEPEIKNEQ